jgi:MFS family permease
MLSIGIIPLALVPWIAARVPESPVWLERRKHVETSGRTERAPIVRLFQRDLIGTTVQCALLMTAFMFSYYAITFWYATLLRSRGIEPLAYLVTLNLGQALGNPVWGAVSDRRLGRRGAITLAALLGVAAVPLYTLTTSATPMWIGAVVMGICGIGIWGMAPTYLTERFPTIVRGVGPGLAYHAGRRDRLDHAHLHRRAAATGDAARHGDGDCHCRCGPDSGGRDLAGSRDARYEIRCAHLMASIASHRDTRVRRTVSGPTAKQPIQHVTGDIWMEQPMALAYACLVLIWASLVAEICNQRRAVPPLTRRVSFAFSLIAGITVGILLSVLGI